MTKHVIKIKRIYDLQQASDGFRILVDRLWPRGIKKASIDLWLKDIAPSNALRQWFNHDPQKWLEFKQRYTQELMQNPELIQMILQSARTITLLYSAKDTVHNNARVLQDYLKNR